LLNELSKLSRIPYATFQAIGRVIYRETRRNDYLSLSMDGRFIPAHDRITAEPITQLMQRIDDRERRRVVAATFLQFFRQLHYLEYADPRRRHLEELRTSVLIFSLVASETRALVEHLQLEQARLGSESGFPESFESFIYCVPLEIRKVIQNELTELTSFKQADAVYIKIENSHGILRDCFQQSVIELARGFDPDIDRHRIFPQFRTHLEQSRMLKHALITLTLSVQEFGQEPSDEGAEALKRLISRFCNRSLRFLMYRDWSSFESFAAELQKCDRVPGMLQLAHRVETYLKTLVREVNKRSVLSVTKDETSDENRVTLL